MSVISELNNLSDVLKWEQEKRYSREALTIAAAEVLALGEVIGRKLVAVPTTGTADGGNTGNGTMTAVAAGSQTMVGSYALTCIEGGGSGAVTTPATGTADGGNTGDGTCTAVTAGASAVAGTYTLTCTAVPTGAATVPATGTAAGGNTGANTMTAVADGGAAKVGTYTMTCIDATVAGSEIFQVMDPDGNLLPNATVAAAYTNAQIAFTINDPGAKAIVGDSFTVAVTEADHNLGTFQVATPTGQLLAPATVAAPYASAQINFTLNDGNVDYVVGDIFTILASAADGNAGLFAVSAPDGAALPNATVGVAYSNAQLNFTVNDGAIDYAAGDIFTVAVAKGDGSAVGLDLTAVDGTQIAAGFVIAAYDATDGALAGVAVVRDAVIDPLNLVWPAGITAGEKVTALDQLAAKGIVTSTAA